MVGFWISFALIFPIVLFGIPYAKIKITKLSNITITPEMDKRANEKVVRYILFYWLCDLFYMACFINNLVCKYIFGGMIMLVIFMGLARSASYPKEKTSVEKWGMLQDLLVGIGLSVYLIYIIPDDALRTIVTPIVAALYGGLLTLVGVFSTIKHSDKMFFMENKLKNKPILVVVQDHVRESDLPTCGRYAAIKENEKKGFDIQFLVKNIANNPAKIKSIFYKSKEYNFPNEHLWVEGQEELWVCFQIEGFFYGDEFGLIVEDVLNNQYNYLFKTNDVAFVCLMKETENGN